MACSYSGVQRLAWGNLTSNATGSLWNHLSQKAKISKGEDTPTGIRKHAEG